MTSGEKWDDISKKFISFPRENGMTSQKTEMTSRKTKMDISTITGGFFARKTRRHQEAQRVLLRTYQALAYSSCFLASLSLRGRSLILSVPGSLSQWCHWQKVHQLPGGKMRWHLKNISTNWDDIWKKWDDISKNFIGFPRENEMTSQKTEMTSQKTGMTSQPIISTDTSTTRERSRSFYTGQPL